MPILIQYLSDLVLRYRVPPTSHIGRRGWADWSCVVCNIPVYTQTEEVTMARKRIEYTPDPELLAKFPDVSGNEVNGLGETEKRTASPFFWHPPEKQTHGELSAYVLQQFAAQRPGGMQWGDVGGRGPEELPSKADTQAKGTPSDNAATVRDFALAHESDLVGIAAIQDDWVYDGYQIAEPNVIIIGIAQDYEMMKHAPSSSDNLYANTEVRKQYNRGARAAKALAAFILSRGYQARPQFGPSADALNMIPAAIAAGLGELGKHGSLINRHYGSNFRLAAVATDMPLQFDTPDIFGADEFCTNCKVCTDACPPDAIFTTKQTVRGELKWYVDFDKCLPFFAESLNCALCTTICPWSRPGVAERLATKLARKG